MIYLWILLAGANLLAWYIWWVRTDQHRTANLKTLTKELKEVQGELFIVTKDLKETKKELFSLKESYLTPRGTEHDERPRTTRTD